MHVGRNFCPESFVANDFALLKIGLSTPASCKPQWQLYATVHGSSLMEEEPWRIHRMESSWPQCSTHPWRLHGKVDTAPRHSHGTCCQSSWSRLPPSSLYRSRGPPRNDSDHRSNWRCAAHLVGTADARHCSPCSRSSRRSSHPLPRRTATPRRHKAHCRGPWSPPPPWHRHTFAVAPRSPNDDDPHNS